MRKMLVLFMGILMLIALVLITRPWGQTIHNEMLNKLEETSSSISSITDQTMPKEDEPVIKQVYQAKNPDQMIAMWLSQFDLSTVYSADQRQRAERDYTVLIKRVLDRVVETGINTVIVQVRPNMDSMYPSKICPMSKYVVGEYGLEAEYDPFQILLTAAHERGLSVHAWINPLRGMLTEEIEAIPNAYRVRQLYDDDATRQKVLVLHEGRWYLNPAYEEARELIISGAREILENYEVDGLHMDDYFYPSGCTEAFDESAYVTYLKNSEKRISLQAFRREQVNTLVRELYATVKKVNSTVLFGISPGGNMETNYNRLGADVYTWCREEGYIDYICPQVYWGMEHETYDFVSVCKTFDDMIQVDGLRLVIGMTLGKAYSQHDPYAGSGKWEWRDHKDILYRCLQHTKTLDHCRGVSYFCYQYFYDPISGTPVSETKEERSLFVPLLKSIQWKTTDD